VTAPPDPIREALDKAKTEYKASITAATKAVLDKFDERIKSAADAGKLDDVLRLREERKAFDEYGTPPKVVALKTAIGEYQTAVKAARKKVGEAYELAVKEYTKKLDTDSAEEIRAEYQLFKSGPARPVPSIAGAWQYGAQELKGRITIVQKGENFTADGSYQHPQQGEIQWRMTGTISTDGAVKGKLVHTKAPPSYGPQVRTGTLSEEGDTITGQAEDPRGGGKHEFVWKRVPKKP
jgi:hypothetical protein